MPVDAGLGVSAAGQPQQVVEGRPPVLDAGELHNGSSRYHRAQLPLGQMDGPRDAQPQPTNGPQYWGAMGNPHGLGQTKAPLSPRLAPRHLPAKHRHPHPPPQFDGYYQAPHPRRGKRRVVPRHQGPPTQAPIQAAVQATVQAPPEIPPTRPTHLRPRNRDAAVQTSFVEEKNLGRATNSKRFGVADPVV